MVVIADFDGAARAVVILTIADLCFNQFLEWVIGRQCFDWLFDIGSALHPCRQQPDFLRRQLSFAFGRHVLFIVERQICPLRDMAV